MLDCDASFVSVPEFASIRRPLPARLMAATALSDAPAAAVPPLGSAPLHKAERQIGETFTAAARPAFVDALPACDLPPIPVPPMADLRSEAARSYLPAEAVEAAPATTAPEAEVEVQGSAEQRPVTPRRPMRFTSARAADEAAPITLPSFNLFDGVFEDTALDSPGIDPRLQRSRARALARLAVIESALTPVERNLWHDDPAPETAARPAAAAPAVDEAQTAAPVVARAEGAVAPRRPVRQLGSADAVRTARPAPQIQDPLRERLRDLRDILYSPDPEEVAAALAAAPQQQPLRSRALAVLTPVVALLLGLLVTALQAVRTRAASRRAAPSAAMARSAAAPRTAALSRLLPRRTLVPRLGLATAALAALATPVGLMQPVLLPFL